MTLGVWMTSRTRLIGFGLALILSSATPAVASSPPAAWDHDGYDAEDSYFNPSETRITPSTVVRLTRRWKVSLRTNPDETCAQGQGMPLVSGSHVIVADQLGLAAFTASTGHPQWTFTWPDPSDSGLPMLAISGNIVIAAMATCQSMSDPNGEIVALDLRTGHPLWTHAMQLPAYSLAVDKGAAVIYGESDSDDLDTVAFSITDGHQLWHKPGYTSSGVSANGTLLLTTATDTVAVDITSGHPVWKIPGVFAAQAATPASDRFLTTSGTTLTALNVYDGSTSWTAPDKAGTLLATDGQRIYRVMGDAVESLVAWTGRRAWFREFPTPLAQPSLAAGVLYTGTNALNAKTGALLTRLPGHNTITNGRLCNLNAQTLTAMTP